MKFFSHLFSKPKPKPKPKPPRMEIDGVGCFEFYKDKVDQYWQVEKPVLDLPPKFDFGAIEGDANEMNADAFICFKKYAANPCALYKLLPDVFFSTASPHFDNLNIDNVEEEFYIKSLTTTGLDRFEFGLHSKSKDIFIEIFVREGEAKEVFLDSGCCD